MNIGLPVSTGSISSVQYELHGQRTQDPTRWDLIGAWRTLKEARKDERDYRAWSKDKGAKRWMDFRVAQVTTTIEILPINTKKKR